VETIGGGAAV